MRFRLEPQTDCIVLHCDAALDAAALADFAPPMREAVERVLNGGQVGPLIVDFKGKPADPKILSALLPFAQQLSAKFKSIYALNTHPAAQAALQAAKLKTPIRFVTALTQAVEHGNAPAEISSNSELIAALLESLVESFKNVAPEIKVTAGKAFLRNNSNGISTDICATTEIEGKRSAITFALCFTEKTFLAVLGAMHGETYTSFTPEMIDGAVELVNIIGSVSKKKMFESGYVLQKSIPTPVKGTLIDKLFAVASCVIILPFSSSLGAFHIQLGISYR